MSTNPLRSPVLSSLTRTENSYPSKDLLQLHISKFSLFVLIGEIACLNRRKKILLQKHSYPFFPLTQPYNIPLSPNQVFSLIGTYIAVPLFFFNKMSIFFSGLGVCVQKRKSKEKLKTRFLPWYERATKELVCPVAPSEWLTLWTSPIYKKKKKNPSQMGMSNI